MKNSASILIDRPIDEVFLYTNDHVPEWSIVVVEEDRLHDTDEVVGSTFCTVTEDRGQRMTFDGTVTQFEPPNRSAVKLVGQSFDIEAEYIFKELGTQTQVTQNSIVKGKGFFAVFLFLFGWLMKKSSCDATQKELNSLKAFCESQP